MLINLQIKINSYAAYISQDQTRFKDPFYYKIWILLNDINHIIMNKAKYTKPELKDILICNIRTLNLDIAWWKAVKTDLNALIETI